MITLAIVLVVVVIAIAAAQAARRRSPDAPSTPAAAAPAQLDRGDFDLPEREWLLVLFSSATCLSCADARATVAPVDLPTVVVQEAPLETHKGVHQRYRIDAVPMVVLADREGVVRWSSVGPPTADDVARALAEAGATD